MTKKFKDVCSSDIIFIKDLDRQCVDTEVVSSINLLTGKMETTSGMCINLSDEALESSYTLGYMPEDLLVPAYKIATTIKEAR